MPNLLKPLLQSIKGIIKFSTAVWPKSGSIPVATLLSVRSIAVWLYHSAKDKLTLASNQWDGPGVYIPVVLNVSWCQHLLSILFSDHLKEAYGKVHYGHMGREFRVIHANNFMLHTRIFQEKVLCSKNQKTACSWKHCCYTFKTIVYESTIKVGSVWRQYACLFGELLSACHTDKDNWLRWLSTSKSQVWFLLSACVIGQFYSGLWYISRLPPHIQTIHIHQRCSIQTAHWCKLCMLCRSLCQNNVYAHTTEYILKSKKQKKKN